MVRKRKSGASSSQVPIPKHRRTEDDSSLPTVVPQVPIRYQDMPLNHKKKFFIYDDCGGLRRYMEVICWLRSMGCFLGSVFDDIPNLNWSVGKGYPLVEIEVITPQDTSAKFIIYKNTLYMVAFRNVDQGFQFKDCGFIIEGFTILQKYDGKYQGKPWKYVGPQLMINAVNSLASGHLDTNGNMSSYVDAWEVFVFHLCEAGRYYAVESFVGKSLKPVEDGECEKRTYQNEEDAILVMGDRSTINYKDDIYRLVEDGGCVDFEHTLQAPDYFADLVKQYSNLSKVWYVKSLTGGSLFPITDKLIRSCHVRSKKSLRCTLAVLCNINLDKVVDEWRKKIQGPEKLTLEVFKQMEIRVRELQEKGEVRNPRELVT